MAARDAMLLRLDDPDVERLAGDALPRVWSAELGIVIDEETDIDPLDTARAAAADLN